MKFAGYPKFALLAVLMSVVALALTGCGFFGKDSHNIALTKGNWSIGATSSVPANGTFYIGGNLTQSGSAVSGTLYIVDSLCFDVSQGIAFTGTVNGNKITLASASVQGQVLTITATGDSGSFSGTYTRSSGGNCLNADQGTATANVVPSITGTWTGPIVGDANNDPNVTLSIALNEAGTASSDGTFALTGTLTYAGSTCSASGTIPDGGSFVVGPYVVLNGTTDDGASFSYTAILNSATSPSTMPGGNYETSGGNCNDMLNPTFTKQ